MPQTLLVCSHQLSKNQTGYNPLINKDILSLFRLVNNEISKYLLIPYVHEKCDRPHSHSNISIKYDCLNFVLIDKM